MTYFFNTKLVALTVFTALFINTLTAQNKEEMHVACVGFYNVENLFDTIDHANVRDWEYTPDGKNKWNYAKYTEKLKNLSIVINDMAKETTPDGVAILGVSEVENKGVLEDLVKEPLIKDRKYEIVHYDSPDRRGIDVALLYQSKYFKIKNSVSHKLIFEDKPDYLSRDQLVVTGDLLNEEVSIIVCHWPSRSGGQLASETRRIQAAKLSRQIIDSLFSINPKAKIILLGDLNDDPINKSLKNYLIAKGNQSKVKDGMLFNPMFAIYKEGIGSLAWGNSWYLFDQILVTKSFLGTDYTSLKYYKATVFNKPYMLQSEGRYKGYPKRTTAGGKYLGGYSDHLPVYLTLLKYLK
ncbi:MAG: endonuclease/exonuclease/phosphatase family protein [Crocinitomicaceae bacterium]